MHELAEWFFTHALWQYDAGGSWPGKIYRGLNQVEGCAWLVMSALVLARWLRYRRSPLELVYACAFLTFGLSDFREAQVVEPWLIAFKGANLVLLLMVRRKVLERYYPKARTW